jgi:MFS family permease
LSGAAPRPALPAPPSARSAPGESGWSGRAFALACVVNFAAWTAGYVLLGTLALYAVGLGVPEAQVGWYPACCSVFGLLGQLTSGRYQASARRLWFWRGPPLVMAGASLVGAAVASPAALFVVCGLFGLSYGALQTTALVVATEAAPPARRGQAVGMYGTFTTLGVLIGPPLGVAVLQHGGGTALFALAFALGLVTVAITLGVPLPAARRAAAGATRAPLHPLVYFAAVALFGMTATWGTIVAFVPLYAPTLGLENPGWYFSVQAVGVLLLRAATGRLSDRLGRIQVLVPATVLVAVGVWGLALHPSVPMLLALALCYGLGYSAIHPTTMALADDVSTPANRGPAFAVVGAAFSVGSGTGALTMGYVLAHSSFETTFLVAGVVPLVATGLCVWRWWTYPAWRRRASGSGQTGLPLPGESKR